ncbi:hypothetical protein HYY73_02160 [Candidatus Woesearchaeota archaeon]|nr:hypothetical protein [Candidatus Woesearchaeota archaeon]
MDSLESSVQKDWSEGMRKLGDRTKRLLFGIVPVKDPALAAFLTPEFRQHLGRVAEIAYDEGKKLVENYAESSLVKELPSASLGYGVLPLNIVGCTMQLSRFIEKRYGYSLEAEVRLQTGRPRWSAMPGKLVGIIAAECIYRGAADALESRGMPDLARSLKESVAPAVAAAKQNYLDGGSSLALFLPPNLNQGSTREAVKV